MTQHDISLLKQRFLDGSATQAECRKLADALQGAQTEDAALWLAMLPQQHADELPADFAAALTARIEAEEQKAARPKSLRLLFRRLAAAAVVVGIAVVGVTMWWGKDEVKETTIAAVATTVSPEIPATQPSESTHFQPAPKAVRSATHRPKAVKPKKIKPTEAARQAALAEADVKETDPAVMLSPTPPAVADIAARLEPANETRDALRDLALNISNPYNE
ncbi:MAG: hypothetical protein J6M53_02855 [Bacteroidaceae bacterium]|nr:hypothetical protein [Bacteroidaceae bacterium]